VLRADIVFHVAEPRQPLPDHISGRALTTRLRPGDDHDQADGDAGAVRSLDHGSGLAFRKIAGGSGREPADAAQRAREARPAIRTRWPGWFIQNTFYTFWS
jgi:hypothetical protein